MSKVKNSKGDIGQKDYCRIVGGYFEELFLALINNDNARENLHFKYVSPEWIGNPGWYFWPKGKKGVYCLKVVDAVPLKDGIDALLHVYYYPHPQEDVFSKYSFIEQLTRVSHVFESGKPGSVEACPCHHDHQHNNFADLQDGLGIPVPVLRSTINPWLYRLGDLICYWEKGKLKSFVIEAQEKSRTWSCRSISEVPGEVLLDFKEIDRDLPAWELIEDFCRGFVKDLSTLNIYPSKEICNMDSSSGIKSRKYHLRGNFAAFCLKENLA